MVIHSERLMMHPVSDNDVESLLDVFRDPAVRRYLLDDSLVSLEWVHNEIASSNKRFAMGGAGMWMIRLMEATMIVGFVGFREFFDPPRLQLLYGLLPEYWGQGFAFEAARRICDHAFGELNFSRIEAAMDTPNERSVAVVEHLGLARMDIPGTWSDATVFYEIDRDTWNAKY